MYNRGASYFFGAAFQAFLTAAFWNLGVSEHPVGISVVMGTVFLVFAFLLLAFRPSRRR